jgi:hypothetical protein
VHQHTQVLLSSSILQQPRSHHRVQPPGSSA